MGSVRTVVSGWTPSELLQAEVHALTKEERQKLLTDAGFDVEISADHAIPWNKLRVIRR